MVIRQEGTTLRVLETPQLGNEDSAKPRCDDLEVEEDRPFIPSTSCTF